MSVGTSQISVDGGTQLTNRKFSKTGKEDSSRGTITCKKNSHWRPSKVRPGEIDRAKSSGKPKRLQRGRPIPRALVNKVGGARQDKGEVRGGEGSDSRGDRGGRGRDGRVSEGGRADDASRGLKGC